MILERTVVVVVRGAGIADDYVSTPCYAMELIAVAVAADGARDVRAVGVIDALDPVAGYVKLFTLFPSLSV